VAALRARKDKVISTLTGGLSQLARRRNVTLVHGAARFVNSTTLEVAAATPGGASQRLTFDHCILASGSRPARVPAFDIGSPRVMDSTGALELADVPESLLVVGGGYIGLEMGTVYAELGSKVSVVELTDMLLPGADRDLVKPLQKRLEGLFEAIMLRTKVVTLEDTGTAVRVSFEGPEGPMTKEFSRVLVAVGRRPNSDGIGLENTQVIVSAKGFVEVDGQQRTADPTSSRLATSVANRCSRIGRATRARWRSRSSTASRRSSHRGRSPLWCSPIRRSPGRVSRRTRWPRRAVSSKSASIRGLPADGLTPWAGRMA
jgi:dihydrolipoamide dehydrogenase